MTPVACVCAWCERARNSAGRWERVDLNAVLDLAVTHGICPDCLERETRDAVADSALALAASQG